MKALCSVLAKIPQFYDLREGDAEKVGNSRETKIVAPFANRQSFQHGIDSQQVIYQIHIVQKLKTQPFSTNLEDNSCRITKENLQA